MNPSDWWQDDMDAWTKYTEALKANAKPRTVSPSLWSVVFGASVGVAGLVLVALALAALIWWVASWLLP